MLKTRFLALVAALAMGFGPAFAAPVKAPVVYDSSGRPLQSTPVICIDNIGAYLACGGSGSGGAGASYTAASGGSLPVTAGTNKPAVLDLFSHQGFLMFDNMGNYLDLTAPSGVYGVNGTSIATLANPFPTSAALVAGTAVIGHVINDASSAVIGHVIADSGSTTVVTGTVTANATLQTQTDTVMVGGVNVKEINGVTPLMGNGVTGAGSHRVTVASDNTPFAVKIDQTTLGTTNATAIKDVNNVAPDFTKTTPTAQVGPYPSLNTAGTVSSATPETCSSGNVANATVACTLAASSGKTTYITGFTMTGDGATVGLAVSCTLTGTITGTMTYTFGYPIGVAVPAQPLTVTFAYPVPASTTNTTIVASCPASGTGGTNAAISATGFQL